MSQSTFQALQEAIAFRLESIALFQEDAVKVFTRKSGSIHSRIAEQLGRIGLTVFVLPIMPTQANRGLPGPYYPEVQVEILSYESPATNTTATSAYELADAVESSLHRWNPGIPRVGSLFIDEQPRTDDSTDTLFIFRSSFTARIGQSAT